MENTRAVFALRAATDTCGHRGSLLRLEPIEPCSGVRQPGLTAVGIRTSTRLLARPIFMVGAGIRGVSVKPHFFQSATTTGELSPRSPIKAWAAMWTVFQK